MKSLLLKPKHTLAVLITGLASLAGLCTSVAVALSPLETTAGLEHIRPKLTALVIGLGATSAVCLALAAVGRSISTLIDNGGTPADPPPTPPAAVQGLMQPPSAAA